MSKEKPQIDVIYIGNKKFKRGMEKPSKLPKYNFPSDFFAKEEVKKEEPK